jgi:hypothetical protein
LQRVIVPNIRDLLTMFRRQGLPIVVKEFGSRAADGRDPDVPFLQAAVQGPARYA